MREDLLNDDKMAIIDQRLAEFKQGLTDEWVVENMKSNMGTLTAQNGGIGRWYPLRTVFMDLSLRNTCKFGSTCEGVQTPVSSMQT